nr:MAG: hypothetical protein [Wufeng shrew polycipivirus 5]
MSIEQANCPPRAPTVPQLPQPQTCFGVLEHTGIPTNAIQNVTDIPPDFSWMTEMQTFVRSFTFSISSELSTFLLDMAVHAPDQDNNIFSDAIKPLYWQYIPFLMSKWWTGSVSFKFLAIKPPRVTGKLIVRYVFRNYIDGKSDDRNLNDDTMYRSISKEWDLGSSNEFEFDIDGLSVLEARPTWLPETGRPIPKEAVEGSLTGFYAVQEITPSAWMMGRVIVQPAQRLQPGGIFPDTIRILVFRTFKNANFYIPSDARVYAKNAICTPLSSYPRFMDYP